MYLWTHCKKLIAYIITDCIPYYSFSPQLQHMNVVTAINIAIYVLTLHYGNLRWIISRLVHFHFIHVIIKPQTLTTSVVSHSINFLSISYLVLYEV